MQEQIKPMKKLSSVPQTEARRIMLYGPPKTGKSLIAGRLAEHFNLLWFDLENGFKVLQTHLPAELQEKITLIQLPDTRSYPIAIETCLKVVKNTDTHICDEHGKVACGICYRKEKDICVNQPKEEHGDVHLSLFTEVNFSNLGPDDLVVFDSATQLTNSAIANITKNKDDDYKLDWDDWGALGKLMDIFYSHIQQANYNCIVISHETDSESITGREIIVPVSGTRNFSRNVAKYFDDVVYMERKNNRHIAASSSNYSPKILTGSRTGIALEDYPDGEEVSLLPLFRPELCTPKPGQTGIDKSKPNKGGDKNVSDLLASMKKK